MDNNNPVNSTTQPATAQPVVNPQPQPAAPQVQASMPTPSGGSKKMIIMFILGFVIVLLIVGGIYWFLSKQQSKTQQTSEQSVTKTPTVASIKDALDQELDSINVSASEGDFKSVDQDLQSL